MENGPIVNHKIICRSLAPEGWSYTGFNDGFYLFQSGDYKVGFKEMKCVEEDLTSKNLQLMVKMNLTRS